MTLNAFLTDVARARGAFIDGKHLAQVRVGDTLVQDTVTNLFTNSSFASVVTPGGLVEVRRNRAVTPRPNAYAGTTWGAPANLQSVPEPGWLGGTLTAATTPYIFSATSSRAYAAGDKVTLSIRYRVTAANTGAAQHISVIPHIRTGNAYYRGTHVTRPMVVGQNEDVVVQWTTPIDIAAGQLDIAIVGANAAGTGLAAADAGFGLQATRALIEDGWTDGSFFDGASSPDIDLTPAWTGATNASASILTGKSIAGVTPTGCVAIQSTRWAKEGAYSMRLIPTSPTDNYSCARIPIPAGAVRAAGTMLATLRLAAPLTGSLSAAARSIRARNPDQRVQAPNTAGAHDLRLTFSALADTYFIELMHGGLAGSGDVWWDLATLIAGNYTGKPASGDSPGWAWDGTPHNSTSHGWR
jgi:hypothetical protein